MTRKLTNNEYAQVFCPVDLDGALIGGWTGAVPSIVGGRGFNIPVTLTVTNGAYSIGDVVGGLITFPSAASGAGKRSKIHTITLGGVAALEYNLWLFSADLVTPLADNAAFAIVAADVPKVEAIVPIVAADYKPAQSAFNVATKFPVGLEIFTVATSLYAYMYAIAVTSPGTTVLTLTIRGEFLD